MQVGEIVFEPRAWVEFNEKEVEVLLFEAKHHYDAVCREAANDDGVVGRFARRFKNETAGPQLLTFREIDTICKICEMAQYMPKKKHATTGMGIMLACRRLLTYMNEITPRPKVPDQPIVLGLDD